MSHGVHPNYASKHQDEHKPKLNGGVVIKLNAKQRYATDVTGAFLIRQLAALKKRTCQDFEIRNDIPCGSTVGRELPSPGNSSRCWHYVAYLSKLGMRTVDVGLAQLSMHSIREMCGADDVQAYIDLFDAFYESFDKVDAKLNVD